MRVAFLPSGPILLLVAALGLAGCALQNALNTEAITRIAAADQPPPKDQVVSARAEPKVAEIKPARAKTAVAKTPPQRQAAAQDEASCAGVETCASVLKAMVGSADRSWIGRPTAPSTLANGVRLFAYRALKPQLTCDELAAAQSEVETAARTLSGPVADLEPKQAVRARSLCVAVGGELKAEHARRCPPPGKDGPVG